MKREPLTARDIAILSSVVILAVCCVCAGLALATIEDAGRFFTAPFRWFSQLVEPGERDLYRQIASRSQASFMVGQNCYFSHTSGSIVASQGLVGQERAFAGELQSQEVVDHVLDFLSREVFVAGNGEITLASGTPVSISLLDGDQVYLSLVKDEKAGEIVGTANLEGVVDHNQLEASYTGFYKLSSVVEGVGVEEAVTVVAGLTCPLVWIGERP